MKKFCRLFPMPYHKVCSYMVDFYHQAYVRLAKSTSKVIQKFLINILQEGFWTVWLPYSFHWTFSTLALETILKLRCLYRIDTTSLSYSPFYHLENIMDFRHAKNHTVLNMSHFTSSNYFFFFYFILSGGSWANGS